MHIKKHFFFYTIIGLTILAASASFYRFMVIDDYLVSYEGPCDPAENTCFVECEDEECTSEYYFSQIERKASVIKELCGVDITDCEAANYCTEGETKCSITYCEPEVDGEDYCFYSTDNQDNI